MVNLKDLTIEQMEEFFQEIGEKPYRARQVFQWIYKGAAGFSEMTNLPKPLRETLQAAAVLENLQTVRVQRSGQDGTGKYLFALNDGNRIESVFMKYRYGNAVCVSSQAGCRMGCAFCASAIGGLKRNLTPGEMADQIIAIERDTGEKINHVAVMGTGEPLDNYEHLRTFIALIHAAGGLNIGLRNITVSTCGLIPVIHKFAKDLRQVNLAVSLHSADDRTRDKIMPVNKAYPVRDLLQACRAYTKETGRRVTFEYALIKGVNDGTGQIELLARELEGMLCHVNLIPLNEVAETGLRGGARKRALAVAQYLEDRGIPATVRRELGTDIDAACGQLRLG